MFVTFDSNVSRMILLVNKRFQSSTTAAAFKIRQWCASTCKCEHPQTSLAAAAKDVVVLYYDTPISMCDDVTKFPPISNFDMHFIYIDFAKSNQSLKRIMLNLKHLQYRKYVIISNSEMLNIGMYRLLVRNSPETLVADSVAAIVRAHIARNGPVYDIDEITRYVSNNTATTTTDDKTTNDNSKKTAANAVSDAATNPVKNSITFDVIQFAENKRPDIIDDCVTNVCNKEYGVRNRDGNSIEGRGGGGGGISTSSSSSSSEEDE